MTSAGAPGSGPVEGVLLDSEALWDAAREAEELAVLMAPEEIEQADLVLESAERLQPSLVKA